MQLATQRLNFFTVHGSGSRCSSTTAAKKSRKVSELNVITQLSVGSAGLVVDCAFRGALPRERHDYIGATAVVRTEPWFFGRGANGSPAPALSARRASLH
jgi:hypothetical protein